MGSASNVGSIPWGRQGSPGGPDGTVQGGTLTIHVLQGEGARKRLKGPSSASEDLYRDFNRDLIRISNKNIKK